MIRDFTLWARALLVQETGDLLRGVYGLKEDGTFFPAKDMPALQIGPSTQDSEAQKRRETRRRLEQLIADECDADVKPAAAVAKLVKEVAFTHLNRLVAFKMLEHPDRRVLKRAAIEGYPEPNGFRMYLPDHAEDYSLYERGTTPLDSLGEGPRDRAYRHFLLWQSGELAKEIRVLFDPDNLASRLFPRPNALRPLIERLNSEELKEAWRAGNEETVGWVYQFFNAEEKAAAFKKVFKDKKKFLKEDIPAATQVFTPRWIVKFLAQNSLGRLWLSMHPDSALAADWDYLVPPAENSPSAAFKSVKEIHLLDPATGTMHFGLVAFDLLVNMYREEIANVGKSGWPNEPSVPRDEDIPASILANNLFGIDIDLRAVQLSALALYIRAKAHHRDAVLTESNLACADVTMFRGTHRNKIAHEMAFPKGLSLIFDQFCDTLDDASFMGSLVRIEKLFREKLQANELKSAIDAYVRKKAAEGVDESYFGSETAKGLRLLEVLNQRYDVVFTNPPYMSNRNMSPAMSAFMKGNYKNSKGDLYSGFIERCAELLAEGGRMAMITQQSFMFISSYEDLRGLLLGKTATETMAHVGPHAFDEVKGEKVNTTAFVLRRQSSANMRRDSIGVYFRLVKERNAGAKRTAFEQALAGLRAGQPDSHVYEYRQGDFAAIPGSPWVYWITPGLLSLFRKLKKLEEVAQPRVGLQTGLNERFLRYWWEEGLQRIERSATNTVAAEASGQRWFPYMKGGGFKRWFGNQDYAVNWLDDGREIKACTPNSVIRNPDYYFRRGVTWTDLAAGKFSARLSPGGFIFDVSGSSVFPDDVELVLAVMNSTWAQYALKLINPTAHVQVGDLSRLPLPKQSSVLLRNSADRTIALAQEDSEEDETTYDFNQPPAWPEGVERVTARHRDLVSLEKAIDEEVYRLYEISVEDCRAIEAELSSFKDAVEDDEDENGPDGTDVEEASQLTQQELAAQWIRYVVGVALGRFEPGIAGALGCGHFSTKVAARLRDLADKDGMMVLDEGHSDDLARRVLDILSTIYGDVEAERIVRTATESTASLRDAVETYLTGDFFRDHVKRYRKCPIYWLIQSRKKYYSIYLFHEKATPDTLSLLRGNRYLGGRLNRLKQEQTSLSESARRGDKGAAKKAGLVAELIEELQDFDRRIEAATRFAVKDKNGHDVTVRWEPELDDGVYINAAPLHELLPSWGNVNPKKAWLELAAGDFDWSVTAMRYWPQRVLKKCKDNKSYAIAHGLA
jgi:hypothetical protein